MLKLEARSRIDQIQFLGHNFMIPKEVEIWLGDLPMASDDPELSKAMFYCLGVVSRSIIFMSPVSPIFHIVSTVNKLISNMF